MSSGPQTSSGPHSPSTGRIFIFQLSSTPPWDKEMPPNNQNRSSGQRLPTDLEGPFRKIGIPAVAAAARYTSERKRRGPRTRAGGAGEKERSKRPKD
jgi:hypothetical protein